MFNSDPSSGFSFGVSGLTPLNDDDDLLSLLANGSNHPGAPNAPNHSKASLAVHPSDLSTINLVSPLSSDSDSPPTASQPQLTLSATHPLTLTSTTTPSTPNISLNIPMNSRATRSANRDSQTGEPNPKRKLFEEDDDDESDDESPQRKFQHTDLSGSKKSATKRKSIGGQDDARLQKRKEQNRAAQRAFRERKERHVKDLEDKVAILEAKTDTQAAENENLRELLTRLQQENLQLKQNQFNFTFQQPIASTSANPNPTQLLAPRQTHTGSSSDANMAGPTTSEASSTAQSPLDEHGRPSSRPSNGAARPNSSTPQLTNSTGSPNDLNLLESLGLGTSSTPDLTFSGGLTGLSPPASNLNGHSFTMLDSSFFNNNPPPATNGTTTADFTSFGDIPSFTPMPYQTIATSQWTSYRDPTANPNAWASFGPNSSQSLALNTYDELFAGAGALSALSSAGPDANMAGGVDDLMPFSFLPDLSNGTGTGAGSGAGAGAGGSQFGGLSPISHLPTPPSVTAGGPSSASSTNGNAPATSVNPDHEMSNSASPHENSTQKKGECPRSRQEFAEAIEKLGSGTFGPPVDQVAAHTVTPAVVAAAVPQAQGPDSSPTSGKGMSEMYKDDKGCVKMPKTDSTKLNLDIGTAWRAVRQHPQFEECDIDELCAELAQKATCDGSGKVIEAEKIMDIVHSIPERAKQRKLSMATRLMMTSSSM